jgi:hypothetical protein
MSTATAAAVLPDPRTCRTCGRDLEPGERRRCRDCKLLTADSSRQWGWA